MYIYTTEVIQLSRLDVVPSGPSGCVPGTLLLLPNDEPVMTAIVMFLFWKNRRVTVNMAIFFCLLYLVFIGYAVAGGLGWSV